MGQVLTRRSSKISIGLAFIFVVFGWGEVRARELAPAGLKPSLQKIVSDFGDQPQISEYFKKAPEKAAPLKKSFKKQLVVLDAFLGEARSSSSFARGEIEDEKVLNGLIQMLQLSILRVRETPPEKSSDLIRRELGAWLTFAADFSYEESSFIGMKVASVIRALVLDELEQFEKTLPGQDSKQLTAWVEWSQAIRMPWPIDRVIISEGRRALEPRLHGLASQVAARLQSNPYQTAASILDRLAGGKAESTGFLRQMWAEKDLAQMKEEVSRLQGYQLRWGFRVREALGHKAPHSMLEVAKAAGFSSIPINYKSGRAWDIEALQ